jgi:hypothetical protein
MIMKALLSNWPLIKKILEAILREPNFAVRLHEAMKKAEETEGDTSSLEDIIRRGS